MLPKAGSVWWKLLLLDCIFFFVFSFFGVVVVFGVGSWEFYFPDNKRTWVTIFFVYFFLLLLLIIAWNKWWFDCFQVYHVTLSITALNDNEHGDWICLCPSCQIIHWSMMWCLSLCVSECGRYCVCVTGCHFACVLESMCVWVYSFFSETSHLFT